MVCKKNLFLQQFRLHCRNPARKTGRAGTAPPSLVLPGREGGEEKYGRGRRQGRNGKRHAVKKKRRQRMG